LRKLKILPEILLVALIVGFFMVQLGSPQNLLYPPASPFSDLMLSHWPNAHFVRSSVLQEHVWPLWNPTQFIGAPFAANPLSGLWYPPNLILLVLPLTPGFNLLLILHLCLGGIGMSRLTRLLGVGTHGGLVAGLAWAFTPKIWAHLGAGHVGLIYASGWLPWLALTAVRFGRTRVRRDGSGFAITWALQFLADPRLATYSAATIAVIVVWWVFVSRDQSHAPKELQVPRTSQFGLLPPWLAAGALGLALTAVQWLPLFDYLPDTQRADLTVGQSAIYSLPPRNLIGLLWADRGGFHEWIVYVGVFVLGLAVLGGLALDRRALWWTLLGFLVLVLFALGDNTPLYTLLSRLPGATLLRVPPRIWFLVSFCLAILAGQGADLLCGQDRRGILKRYRLGLNRLAMIGLGTSGMAAVGLVFVDGAESVVSLALFSFVWLLLLVLLIYYAQRWGKSQVTGVLLTLFLLTDLIWMDASLVARRSSEDLFDDGQETVKRVAGHVGRIYAPSFRPGPQIAAQAALRIVNGVDPLQPSKYATFLNAAAGVPASQEYSITLPSIQGDRSEPDSADVNTALSTAIPSPRLLAVLGVNLVVSQFPIDSALLTEMFRHQIENLIVYANRAAVTWPAVYQRVDSVPDLESSLEWLRIHDLSSQAVVTGGHALDGSRGATPAELVSLSPNRMTVQASGPGLLVVSELDHPGWYARVDGEPAEIVAANGVLRGVYLDAGDHRVEMFYRPVSVLVGAGVTLIALVVVIFARRSGKPNRTRRRCRRL
jgi:hypothetical protein